MDWVSLIVGFVVGVPTGILINYYGAKLTDRRREREAEARKQKEFEKLFLRFPQVLNCIKADVKLPDHQATRRIVVLPDLLSATLPVNINGSYFKYSAEVFDELIPAIHRLEELGYIVQISDKHVPIYRMTEEFVDRLRQRTS